MAHKLSFCCIFCVYLPIFICLILHILLQQPQETILLEYYNETATINYDSYGVPKIQGSNLIAALFAQGYAHANDRLWEMHMKRMLISGRTCEIVGKSTVDFDHYMRSLRLRVAAEASTIVLSDSNRESLQAYVDGINSYVRQSRILPLEFYITRSPFHEWSIVDTLTIVKYMGFAISTSWQWQVFRSSLVNVLGEQALRDISVFEESHHFLSTSLQIQEEDINISMLLSSPHPLNLSNYKAFQDESVINFNRTNTDANNQFEIGNPSSNAWAVHGNFTQSGKPLFSSDPHMPLKIPGLCYLQEIKYGGKTILGATVSGMPSIILGRTDLVAWGYTASNIENIDIFYERINEENKTYFYDNNWIPLKNIKKEVFIIKNGEEEIRETYETHHGPVVMKTPLAALSLFFFGSAAVVNRAFSLSWYGYSENDRTIECLSEITKANSVDDVLNSFRKYDSVASAVVFATADNHIGLISTGKCPLRPNFEHLLFAKDGTLKENDILEYIPDDEMPYVVDPKSGYIMSANNKIVPRNYKHLVGISMSSTARAVVGNELMQHKLEKKEKLNMEDMKEMVLSLYDVSARDILKELLPIVKEHKEKYFKKNDLMNIDFLYYDLLEWDYLFYSSSREALEYSIFIKEIISRLMIEQVDVAQKNVILTSPGAVHFLGRLFLTWNRGTNLAHPYCLNNVTRSKPNPCAFIVVEALRSTYTKLIFKYSENINNWKWGYENVIEYKNEMSGTPLKLFYNRVRLSHGSGNTLNRFNNIYLTENKTMCSGPAYRFLFDLSNYNDSLIALDSGQSSNLFDDTFDKFLYLSEKGGFIGPNNS